MKRDKLVKANYSSLSLRSDLSDRNSIDENKQSFNPSNY